MWGNPHLRFANFQVMIDGGGMIRNGFIHKSIRALWLGGGSSGFVCTRQPFYTNLHTWAVR
jgi:hypothetical protein